MRTTQKCLRAENAAQLCVACVCVRWWFAHFHLVFHDFHTAAQLLYLFILRSIAGSLLSQAKSAGPAPSKSKIQSRRTKPQQILPCSYGENVPASMLMYGSILMEVTGMPRQLSNVPNELAITPLPTPLITPPVTRMYFIVPAICLRSTRSEPKKLQEKLLFLGHGHPSEARMLEQSTNTNKKGTGNGGTACVRHAAVWPRRTDFASMNAGLYSATKWNFWPNSCERRQWCVCALVNYKATTE